MICRSGRLCAKERPLSMSRFSGCSSTSRRAGRGFTLIELLVVIA
ncbi:MAG TPA: hypothetical protein DCX79_13365, partial [Planctomycetaceae bacterium]|nr:hypothetical protein [Planctomycetaceae bacterium]